MTTINNIEDLVRLLDERPEWAEALRQRLLTRELLEMPDALARFIHATDERFDQVEGRLQVVEYDIVQLKADVSYLKGIALETTLHRKIIPRISQMLGLRRAEIKVSPLQGIEPTFRDTIEDGVDNGLISDEQMGRVFETDFILRAIRRDTRSPLWVAVEASHKVREHDISRAVATAAILGTVFDEASSPMVAGLEIGPEDAQRATEAGTVYLEISPD